MKKLIFLLALCLCLNGVAAVGEGGEQAAEASKQTEEAQKRAAEEEPGEAAAEAEAASQEAEDEAAKQAAKEEAERQEAEAKAAEAKAAEQAAKEAAEEEAVKQPAEEEAAKQADEQATDEQAAEEKAAAEQAAPEKAANQEAGERAAEEASKQADEEKAPQEEEAKPAEKEEPEKEADEEKAAQKDAEAKDAEAKKEDNKKEAEPEKPEKPAKAVEAQEEAPELPEDAEAWFERDGDRLGGTLAETIDLLEGGEKVYIRSKAALLVEDAPLKRLSEVALLPDGEVFKGAYEVRLSRDNPATAETPALLTAADLAASAPEARAALYVWVAAAEQTPADTPEPAEEPTGEPGDAPETGEAEPTEEPTAEPTAEPAPTLKVKAKRYEGASWSNVAPKFTLSGIPEGKGWSYAAIIYDERIIPLSENVYVPQEEGVYTVRFAMLDDIGDIVSASEQYTLWLDWTAPFVLVSANEDADYAMDIEASDDISGVKAVSVNGGKKWHALEEGEIYTHFAKKEKTYAPGMIQVRDMAGNIFANELEFTTSAIDPGDEEEGGEDEGGGSGGGSGGGEKKPVLSHASGDGEEGADYDALELELPEEPMTRLTVGGEPMELTLTLESAQEPEAPVGEPQSFTASLARWSPATEEEQPDTLVLNAELAPNLGDQFTYEWRFNGEVYRLLSNSGIKYVALRVGDDLCAFPTEGFTGGTKYTELKMLGVSTRRFDYTLAMKVNLDPAYVSAMSDCDYSQGCDLSIRAEVENMSYELSSSTNSIMYFYNVYLGPEDMLDRPFGAYLAEDGAEEAEEGQ